MHRLKVPTYTDFYGDRLNNIEVDTVTLLNRVTVEVDPSQRHMVASSRKYSSFLNSYKFSWRWVAQH